MAEARAKAQLLDPTGPKPIFVTAETKDGETWCDSCESDSCPCPDPDGCHGERGFYSDAFEPNQGHYETWRRCEACAENAE